MISSGAAGEMPAPQPCCTAAIVPAGYLEVEANYAGDAVAAGLHHSSNLTFKYSLTDRLQLQIAWNNLFVATPGALPHMLDGIAPALKWVLNEPVSGLPQFALSFHAIIPTWGSDDALQSTVDSQALVYVSRDFGRLHLDLTAGLTVANLTAAPVPQGNASASGTWALAPAWALGSGVYSSFGNADRLPLDGGFWVALNWAPLPNVAISVGGELGFFHEIRTSSVFLGVALVGGAPASALAGESVQSPTQVAVRQ